MKVEKDVLGSPSLIVLMVSVDVKQHLKKKEEAYVSGQVLCESREGCSGLLVPNSPCGLLDVK